MIINSSNSSSLNYCCFDKWLLLETHLLILLTAKIVKIQSWAVNDCAQLKYLKCLLLTLLTAMTIKIFNLELSKWQLWHGLNSTTAMQNLLWKPLAFAIMPLELCAIYGHEWPAAFPFGAAVPLRDFSINITWGDSQIRNTNKSWCHLV